MKLEISDLKVIIELAAQVVLLRRGDISTENGSYATTDCDSIIRLDRKIADTFDLDSDDVTFENMNNLLGKIDDAFNAITAVYTSEPISESSQLASIESRLSSIEKLLSADSEPLCQANTRLYGTEKLSRNPSGGQ